MTPAPASGCPTCPTCGSDLPGEDGRMCLQAREGHDGPHHLCQDRWHDERAASGLARDESGKEAPSRSVAESGVERARREFYEAARRWAAASKADVECTAPFKSEERVGARITTVGAHLAALDAYNAMLAAESASRETGRGEGV